MGSRRWHDRPRFATQTGRRVVGENIDNCAGLANDPIEWPRTHVNSNTARMKPCRRNAIRVRTETECRVVGVILG
jgi:hypothetical protein